MKTLMMLGLGAAAALTSTGALAQTTLNATFSGTGTESGSPYPITGVQHIDLAGKFTSYAASSNLPQLTGNDLNAYSFDFNGVATGFDAATNTATYSVSGTISGYGSVVQNFLAEPLTVAFNSDFSSASIFGTLVSAGAMTPVNFPGPVDFTPANGASITGTYTSFGVLGGGGSFVGAINFPAVPEPATWSMMILGMGAVGYAMRRRKATTRVTVAA